MSQSKFNSDSTKKVSINQLKHMDYMQMIEHYIEYPAKGLKYSFDQQTFSNLASATTSSGMGKNVSLNIKGSKKSKINFVNEKEKAEGWRDNF